MNMFPALLGSLILGVITFLLRKLGYQANYLFALPAGCLLGFAVSLLVSKLARRELKCVSNTYITNALPSKPPLVERVEQDGMLYYRVHSVSRESKISKILLPVRKVTLCATQIGDDPVVHERCLCVENKFSRLLALTREEFVGYQLVVPFDQLPK